MHILDGKKVSEQILEEIKKEVTLLKQENKKIPHLAIILVGNNPASETYVGAKIKTCERVGFRASLIRLPDSIEESALLNKIDGINSNDDIDGLIVQSPFPKHISPEKVIERISPGKDVDGFHPENLGRMALNMPAFVPATPFGVLQLIARYKIPTAGKHCVVVGRSHLAGLPMSLLMMRNARPGNCTVTVCHSRTADLKHYCMQADILIVATGQTETITADMVKEGAVVIDIGISRIPDASKKSGYRLMGDVKFDEVAPKCSYITPVPGGVGPMTIASLLMNTLEGVKRKYKQV
ncbi:MAG: bifunctional 5,10-methylene-tetrahydrofolate dehydrogenase/5,10-methylene-tetrahydrofolate cyclohydrolase [Bacteroidia bacterium]|jgi:methylenetetrahydrofolate dehydrogenase (NADP+)/methenyltetrahydrofolate cyclohydrolase|nr:bifunctional 5,10-methylene-tetrahydrofolate dehydrogenase/5,10-methylene-tetrahydrofolate cyclohydrolase [Bacteroidia bacterium]